MFDTLGVWLWDCSRLLTHCSTGYFPTVVVQPHVIFLTFCVFACEVEGDPTSTHVVKRAMNWTTHAMIYTSLNLHGRRKRRTRRSQQANLSRKPRRVKDFTIRELGVENSDGTVKLLQFSWKQAKYPSPVLLTLRGGFLNVRTRGTLHSPPFLCVLWRTHVSLTPLREPSPLPTWHVLDGNFVEGLTKDSGCSSQACNGLPLLRLKL